MQNHKFNVVCSFCPNWLGFRGVVAIVLGIIAIALFATVRVPEIRSDKRLIACGANLRTIATAISRYYHATGKLTPTCLRDDHGNPLLSGRVLLLPYLGAQDVYDKVNHREPWDSEHNRAALHSRADLTLPFHCPADFSDADDDTTYVFVTDCGIRLPAGDCEGETIDGLPRDETNTVMMIEVKNWGVNWAEPRDATINDIRQLLKQHGLASPHPVLINVLLKDGRVVWLHTDYFEVIANRSLNNSSETIRTRSSRDADLAEGKKLPSGRHRPWPRYSPAEMARKSGGVARNAEAPPRVRQGPDASAGQGRASGSPITAR